MRAETQTANTIGSVFNHDSGRTLEFRIRFDAFEKKIRIMVYQIVDVSLNELCYRFSLMQLLHGLRIAAGISTKSSALRTRLNNIE